MVTFDRNELRFSYSSSTYNDRQNLNWQSISQKSEEWIQHIKLYLKPTCKLRVVVKQLLYLSPRLNRLLAQQAFLDAWRAEWTRCYMSTRTKQSVTLCVRAHHAVFKRLLLWMYQAPHTSTCSTTANQHTSLNEKFKLELNTEMINSSRYSVSNCIHTGSLHFLH